MAQPSKPRPWDIVLIVTVLLGIGLAVIYAITPSKWRPEEIEGRPLLEQDGSQFVDQQVGIRFNPPTGWGMQVRSTEAPNMHKPERTLVKYKRLVTGAKAAWLRVTVSDVSGDPTPAELIRLRKPKEAGFAMNKEPEDNLTIAGKTASRSTFTGEMEPDAKGARPCTTEIVAFRHGPMALYFAGTFATADREAQQMIRAAIDSIVFDKR